MERKSRHLAEWIVGDFAPRPGGAAMMQQREILAPRVSSIGSQAIEEADVLFLNSFLIERLAKEVNKASGALGKQVPETTRRVNRHVQ